MLTRFSTSIDGGAARQSGKVVSFVSRSVVRFVAALAVGLLSAYILSLFFSAQLTESMIELRKDELKRLVSLGEASIQPVLESFRQGQLEQDEALVETRNILRRLIYDDPATRNYLFMSSYEGRMLVMPFEPYIQTGINQVLPCVDRFIFFAKCKTASVEVPPIQSSHPFRTNSLTAIL